MRRFFTRVSSRVFQHRSPDPKTLRDLTESMEQGAVASAPFFLMLILASILATLGLIADSSATIIGAMIIAPLMKPILTAAFGIAVFDLGLVIRALMTVSLGVCCVVAIGYLGINLIGARIVGDEILSRTSPSLLDLVVAVAAGCAGAYAQTRPKIADSIAGVAIAVALVPPLAVVGIGLALGTEAATESGRRLVDIGLQESGFDVASGGFLLFLTNLIGIIIVAAFIFLLQHAAHWKKAVALLTLISLGGYFLFPPLQVALHEIYVKNRLLRLVHKTMEERINAGNQASKDRIQSVNVSVDETILITVYMTSDRDELLDTGQLELDQISRELAEDLGEEVIIHVDVEAVDIFQFRGRGIPR